MATARAGRFQIKERSVYFGPKQAGEDKTQNNFKFRYNENNIVMQKKNYFMYCKNETLTDIIQQISLLKTNLCNLAVSQFYLSTAGILLHFLVFVNRALYNLGGCGYCTWID